MSDSSANTQTISIQDDNDPEFYIRPEGTTEPVLLDYVSGPQQTDHFLMRITPAQVDLPKGAPVDFTVHIKPLQDFDSAQPLVVRLSPTGGRGTAGFAMPHSPVVSGTPAVIFDGDRMASITMRKTDEAARVIVHTEYPPDWWGGSTKVRVEVENTTPVRFVEANVVVSDRAPATWQRFVGTSGPAEPHKESDKAS